MITDNAAIMLSVMAVRFVRARLVKMVVMMERTMMMVIVVNGFVDNCDSDEDDNGE